MNSAVKEIKTDNNTETRVINATTKFLKNHGYTILDILNAEKFETINVVALASDIKEIAFMNVSYTSEIADPNKEEPPTRTQCEQVAFKWLAENGDNWCDISFRFDVIRVVIVGEKQDRAIIRHQINTYRVDPDCAQVR